jgi:hypothetical protein
MPIIVTRTDVKPSDKTFSHRHSDGGVREEHRETATPDELLYIEYINWVGSYPGILDRRGYPLDENTWVSVMVFEDHEAYLKFKDDYRNHPKFYEYRLRKATESGIVSTYTITEEPFK